MKKTAPDEPQAYAAFLRGINVGGNRVIKMADVVKALSGLGLREVKTVGASGNVTFAAAAADPDALVKSIEAGLQKAFGHAIPVIVRRLDHLRALIASEPFQRVKVTPETRLYVTFRATPGQPKTGLPIPYETPEKNFQILKVKPGEIFSVVDLAAGGTTIDAMGILEKEFGKNVTTRNWNTVKKLAP